MKALREAPPCFGRISIRVCDRFELSSGHWLQVRGQGKEDGIDFGCRTNKLQVLMVAVDYAAFVGV